MFEAEARPFAYRPWRLPGRQREVEELRRLELEAQERRLMQQQVERHRRLPLPTLSGRLVRFGMALRRDVPPVEPARRSSPQREERFGPVRLQELPVLPARQAGEEPRGLGEPARIA